MHTIDQRLATGLRKMNRAYDGLLSVREQVTPAEIALTDQWQADLEPVLRDLYWWPLRNGINEAPTDAQKLRQWLEDRFTDAATITLLALLLRYQGQSVNLGGTMALGMLGINGSFHLTNSGYLAELDDHATMLTSQGTDMSLIDTTIDDLAGGIVKARASTDTLGMLGGLIAAWALQRSQWIAITEATRFVGNGLNWTFANNNVQVQEFVTREDANVCLFCAPLHGQRMRVDSIPLRLRLPIHVMCRCSYRPVLAGWQPPAQVWTGESL